MVNTVLIFKRPTTNIQRGFGLFSLLEKRGFTRGSLNPLHPYIRIESTREGFLFYFSIQDIHYDDRDLQIQDIPANYAEIIKHTFEI